MGDTADARHGRRAGRILAESALALYVFERLYRCFEVLARRILESLVDEGHRLILAKPHLLGFRVWLAVRVYLIDLGRAPVRLLNHLPATVGNLGWLLLSTIEFVRLPNRIAKSVKWAANVVSLADSELSVFTDRSNVYALAVLQYDLKLLFSCLSADRFDNPRSFYTSGGVARSVNVKMRRMRNVSFISFFRLCCHDFGVFTRFLVNLCSFFAQI